jgi:hypothetical protein
MRSFIAALRSLVLPWGATSGARIVLDGVNGRILVYDSNGALAADIIPGYGFEVWDPSGNLRARFSSPLAGAYSAVQFWTGVLEETNQALITLADFGTMNRLVITPGEQSSKGAIEWTITSAPNDDSQGAMLQAVCLTLNDAGNLRPLIDLTGAAAPSEGVRPRTVFYDLWAGTPNGYGEAPTQLRSMGRGLVALGKTNTGSATLSTTAGTWTDLITLSNVPVLTGRRYLLTIGGGHSFVSGGSGFALGDFWEFGTDVNEGAGAIAVYPINGIARVRSTDTVAQRWPIPKVFAIYEPTADGSYTFRARGMKGAGAATVTTTVDYNGNVAPLFLMIEDISAAV